MTTLSRSIILKSVLGLFLALVFSSFALAKGLSQNSLDPLLYFEQQVNDRASQVLATGQDQFANDFSKLPREFDPSSSSLFDIRHLLIPLDETLAWSASEDFESAVVDIAGRPYFRFFIHPMMESYYAAEIEKYGPLQSGFEATPTASPRSLIIKSKTDPSEFYYQKLSLDVDIGGVARVNSNDKLIRAVTATRVLNRLKPTLEARGVFFFPESQAIKAPFHNDGNIIRELPFFPQHPNGKPTMIPGFALLSPDSEGNVLLLQMIQSSGLTAQEFVRTKIIEPLVRSHSFLAFQHGLIHEAHVQNILFVLDENGALTGKIVYRDLDSIKTDFEMRHLRRLDLSVYQSVTDPLDTYQAKKAKDYYDAGYRTYVRGDWGHRIAKAFKRQQGRRSWFSFFSGHTPALSEQEVFEIFDDVVLQEARAAFGEDLVKQSQVKKQSPEALGFSLNAIVQRYKESQSSPSLDQLPVAQRKYPEENLSSVGTVELVKLERLRAGQLIKGSDHVLEWARDEVGNDPERFVFDVIKFGTIENPLYMLLDGHHRAVVIAQDHNPRNWKVRIIEDTTHLESSKQIERLSALGFFWHPSTNRSDVKLTHLNALETNFWRDLAAYTNLRSLYAHLYPKDAHFAELHFAKGLYQELLKRGHKPREMTESQVVRALEEESRSIYILNCQSLLN